MTLRDKIPGQFNGVVESLGLVNGLKEGAKAWRLRTGQKILTKLQLQNQAPLEFTADKKKKGEDRVELPTKKSI